MISILEASGETAYEISTYLLDTKEDLKEVQNAQVGDKVYIISSGEWKILSSANEWKPFIADFDLNEF